MPSCSGGEGRSVPRGVRVETRGISLPVALLCLAACGPRPVASRPNADPGAWQALRGALDAERSRRTDVPWATGLRMTMREPRMGRTLDGRGALAVAPGRALRMILVGPAGATVLDAWATPARWRVAVPPASLLRRGGADDPADLPVGFLRWLFFRPLEGTLFGGSQRDGEILLLLRDGDAVVEERIGRCDRGERVTISRRARGLSERIDRCSAHASVPEEGDRVRYANETTGLEVDLVLEARAASPPSPEAFLDPDGPSPPLEAAPLPQATESAR